MKTMETQNKKKALAKTPNQLDAAIEMLENMKKKSDTKNINPVSLPLPGTNLETTPVGIEGEIKPEKTKIEKKFEILPVNVDRFDLLLQDGGIERGLTILISGGAGTGKTTFCVQSLYYNALAGQRGVYISFEEDPENIKHHMKKNYGWDLYELEKKGLLAFIKFDPVKIARQVEEVLVQESGMLRIKIQNLVLPIQPDRIVIDSISALAIEFESDKNFRKYLKELFHMLEKYNSLNFIIGETEQNPQTYSRSGVEEFLGDGVIVFYNLKIAGVRKNALEILKLRSGKHVKEMIPYALDEKGIEIYYKQKYD
ncbi:MAG: hypothetical protein J4215_03060 [Candidatus Diapherotrites archaeon]|uniref:KaiC domain-containing protein n=1 Tax=Candidatus Iainarchaeum sp. TaxID=3101447 RepID=A0A8T4L4R1_9ARCH|nr:hypothetical protein [Candidatus Diapherotrites archaeon]